MRPFGLWLHANLFHEIRTFFSLFSLTRLLELQALEELGAANEANRGGMRRVAEGPPDEEDQGQSTAMLDYAVATTISKIEFDTTWPSVANLRPLAPPLSEFQLGNSMKKLNRKFFVEVPIPFVNSVRRFDPNAQGVTFPICLTYTEVAQDQTLDFTPGHQNPVLHL